MDLHGPGVCLLRDVLNPLPPFTSETSVRRVGPAGTVKTLEGPWGPLFKAHYG